MKLFVYEHITSGALINQSMPNSLAQEGNDMLVAILQDCHAIETIELTILRDSRLSAIKILDQNARHHCHFITNTEEYALFWQQCLAEADAVFIIAPETEGVLYQLQQDAFALNKCVLGCQLNAIALTSNKIDCDKRLRENNINTAPSCLANQWHLKSFDCVDGYIIKPIDGAGCIDTFVFESRHQLEQHLSQADNDTLQAQLVQSYIKGTLLSLSLLIDERCVTVLSINRQMISQSGNALTFEACLINDLGSHSFSLSNAQQLAQEIHYAIPGLWGFVGVDLITNSEGTVVIDINPRLTTSYIGLSQSLALNPIELLLTMNEQGIEALPTIKQRQKVEVSL
ncbi:MAG: ATP-grasp domain-containing protein [Piscirickettsiaceae bacterium]|nr:ATP-grasp domain-containing protein [Piscirickettsiaceae bacterium]